MPPDCRPCGPGCVVPQLSPKAARALDIRDKLVKLAALNVGAGILQIYGATAEDLDLIAVAEEELKIRDSGLGTRDSESL